MYLSKR